MTTVEKSKAAPFEIEEFIGRSVRRRVAFEARLAIAEAGRLIRSMREKAELNQGDLASAIGTSQAHISDLERGVGPQGPTVAMLGRIAQACGMELSLSARVSRAKNRIPAKRASAANLRRHAAARKVEVC